MIKYIYNLRVDIGRQIWVLKHRHETFDYKVVPKYPTLGRVLKLIFYPPKMPEIKLNDGENYRCYFISGGNLGGFYGPKSIFICPFDIYTTKYLDQEELKNLLKHEITHLKYWSETKNMSFEDRERFVNAKIKEGILNE